MDKVVKVLGMIHIPGVNDKEYALFLSNTNPVTPNNLWYTLP